MLETLKNLKKMNLKKKLFSIILFFSVILNFSNSFAKESVSILLEKDHKGIMVIYRYPSGSDGIIISYGGYKWFKEVYKSRTNNEQTFIQPAKFGVSGDMKSWMLQRYEIDDFYFEFRTRGDDQYINFLSSQAINEIEGYITRGKRFSLATLQPEKAWYAGIWTPVKNINTLKNLSLKNSRTFCMILSEDFMINAFNKELKTNDVSQLIIDSGYQCNNNFELVSKPKPKKYEADKDPSQLTSTDETKSSNETVSSNTNYKNYWWVVIILALGAFFLYTKTVPKPKKVKRIVKSKPTGFKKDLINYWQGKVSYGFSYWVCLTIIGTIISLPALYFFTDQFIHSASELVLLFIMIYALFIIVSQIYLIVGTWRSAEFYKAQKRKLKQSLIWGYLGQISIVLSIIRKFAEFF